MIPTSVLAAAALVFGAGVAFGWAPLYLPILAAVLIALSLLAGPLPTLMRFLIGLFSLVFVALGSLEFLDAAGLFSDDVREALPLSHSPIAAALAIVNYAICFIRPIRTVIDLASPYFEASEQGELRLTRFITLRLQENWIGFGFFAVIIGINIAQVYMNVVFSYWGNRFFTALQQKDAIAFWKEIVFFSFVAAIWITAAVYEVYLNAWFEVRWRRWMSSRYLRSWLNDNTHYRMRLTGEQTDNPDQRIAEDIRKFTTFTRFMYLRFFSSILNLYAFIGILWSLSKEFPIVVGPVDLSAIPGHLVWLALIFAIVATALTHLIGRPLIGLKFFQEVYEADFRYNLVRVRENTEQIALLRGEPVEQEGLMQRLGTVISNTYQRMKYQKRVTFFTAGYNQASRILPHLLLAPAYFATQGMGLGVLTQAADAFNEVQTQLSLFVNIYEDLAEYRAMTVRLTGFEAAIARAQTYQGPGVEPSKEGGTIHARNIAIHLPDGSPLLQASDIAFRKGEKTLITGLSGSGKSTFFRLLAGIWPFGSGKVQIPAGDSIMVMPQRPYMPLGTLRAALTYPHPETTFSDGQIRAALERIGLPKLIVRLDEEDYWADVLSGGEKQRVAMVRALLQKPDWLFLDEATSALDEIVEAELYAILTETLPKTTLVSIGHRSSLAYAHERRIAIAREGKAAHLKDASLENYVSAVKDFLSRRSLPAGRAQEENASS